MPAAPRWDVPDDGHDADLDRDPAMDDVWAGRVQRRPLAPLHDDRGHPDLDAEPDEPDGWRGAPDETDVRPPRRTTSPRQTARPRAARPARRPRPAAVRRSSTPAFEGLTATGAGLVAIIGGGLSALADSAISPGLGILFAIGFVLTSAFVGLRLRAHDMWAAFAVPPLAYIVAAGIGSQVGPVAAGSWLDRTSADMATAVVGQPFVLVAGTVVAIIGMIFRARLARAVQR